MKKCIASQRRNMSKYIWIWGRNAMDIAKNVN